MKKILAVFLLSLAFILPGCGGNNQNLCNFGGFPNGTYGVLYPDGFFLFGTVDQFGFFTVPTRGYTCGQLIVRLGSNFGLALSASPASVYLPSPPASGTITGQSFDATYGTPRVDYFDGNGYLVGSVYATSVSSDGTSLQANMPDLSYVYSGNYQVKVTNKTYDGYYLNIVGSAPMTAWGRDRPDSDGDGWYDDEDCNPYDPYLNYDCNQYCNNETDGGYPTYHQYQEICPY
jgi:hypothetical protein